jgi:hypothetical protein
MEVFYEFNEELKFSGIKGGDLKQIQERHRHKTGTANSKN